MIVVRNATLADKEGIFPLAKELALNCEVADPAFSELFGTILESTNMNLSVAVSDGKTIGYIFGNIHPVFYANGNVAWVAELYVHPDHRRQGIAKQLMQHFEQWALSHNAKSITLATRRASMFYEAIGYENSAGYFKKKLVTY